MKLWMTAVLFLALFLLGAGCVSVPAYERGLLAHPAMGDENDESWNRFGAHISGARESALEPSTSGGGGCGCN